MRKIPGLQAADILAWEANKHLTEWIKQTGRPTRKSMGSLLETLADHRSIWTRDALEELKSDPTGDTL